jgi:hypothetical protein
VTVTGAVAARLAEARERIAAASARAGRSDPVAVVAVTKTFPSGVVSEAVAAGADAIGENRAQELLAKAAEVEGVTWHFVGRLQTNKVKALARHVSAWHSVDRTAAGEAIARRRPGALVYVQVDVGREPQKGGCDPSDAPALADRLRALGLRVEGLMTVPPAGEDPRPHFAALRDLAARCDVPGLSMGMSGDFEVAVEEGATVVRLGSVLFGERGEAP